MGENAYLKLTEQEKKKAEFYSNLQMLLQNKLDNVINSAVKSPTDSRRIDKLKYIAYNRIIDKI